MSSSTLLRRVASASVVGLVTGGLGVVGLASPAAAVTQKYDCVVPIVGDRQFDVDLTVTPATVATGKTVNPKLNAKIVVPEDLAGLMRGVLQIKDIDGTADAATMVGRAVAETTITIPRTPAGTEGPITLAGSAALGRLTAGKPGQSTAVAVEDIVVTMNLRNAANEVTPFVVECTLADGAKTKVGAVTATKIASRTTVKAAYAKKAKRLNATAAVAAGQGTKAVGTVRFVLKRGGKNVAARNAKLNKRGVAKVAFPRVRTAGVYTVVAQYRGSKVVKTSQGRKVVRVR